MNWLIFLLLNLVFLTSLLVQCQQDYSGNSILNCHKDYNNSEPSSSSLYSCNDNKSSSSSSSSSFSSCIAFLIFRSHYPCNSVPVIATLTSSNQSEVARINNVTTLTVFPEDTEVIIPVNCSCSGGGYYEAITKYNIPSPKDTYFTIANDTFQGLSSCTSLMRANVFDPFKLEQGLELEIPLRCACPSAKQAVNGIKHLLTYTVKWHDNLTSISKSFNINATVLVESNGFLQENATLYPFTTLLVPLPSDPFNRINSSFKRNRDVPPIPVRLPKEPVRRSGFHTWILVGGIIAALFAFMIALIVFYCLIITSRKRSIHGFTNLCKTNDVKEEANSSRDIHVEIASFDPVIRSFSYKEMKKATRNFGSKNRIKGCVYQGVVKKEVLAIKKVQCKEACKEVSMLSRINHFNILKLCGFCENRGNCFLVFEYMKNGSLCEWLHNKKTPKDTKTLHIKIQIALDIANGLLYLHNFVKPAYVHKDINSDHILLDKNLRAKISNLGSARASVESTTSTSTTNSNPRTRMVVGTKGYMAPEYINKGIVTPKIDVYAFGVVLLEIITGKEVAETKDHAEYRLRKYVVDDLGENSGMEYAFQVVTLSLNCLLHDPVTRPNMEEIVSALMKIQLNLQKSERMLDHESSSDIYPQV